MQQQIQQHQRQLAQALLMKQQQPPPSHSGLHSGGVKSVLDSFPGHPQAPGLPDLQTKEPQSSNTYSPYSLCECCWPCSWQIDKAMTIPMGLCSNICVILPSWTESKHECKLHGCGKSVYEGPPSAPVAPVAVDTSQLHRKPLWNLFTSRAQPEQAWWGVKS